MRLLSRHSSFVGLAAGLVLLAFQSCKPAKVPAASPQPRLYDGIRLPLIRVGLGTEYRSIDVVCRERVAIYQGADGADSLGSTTGEIHAELTAEAMMAGTRIRLSVQAGTFGAQGDAEAFAELVQKDSAMRAFVSKGQPASSPRLKLGPYRTNEEWARATGGPYQVRIGPFAGRREAEAAVEFLKTKGYPDCFVVEEESKTNPSRGFRMVFSDGYVAGVADETMYIVPAGDGVATQIGGRSYRGIIEIKMNSANRLTVINILNLEDYLRGVVPNEMSPSSFPQIEALKAQAVAARTYALKNLGQFGDYDICATPVCQVYEGAATETALTDRAVIETTGEVALYKGDLINALYTSTCGGSTEYADKIFEGQRAPYLRPVACYPEAVSDYEVQSPVSAWEDPEALPLAVLGSLGIANITRDSLSTPATPEEISLWTGAALAACHRKGTDGGRVAITHIGPLATYLIDRFGWNDKRDRLFDPKDVDLDLAPFADAAELSGQDRLSVGFLLDEKLLQPEAPSTLGSEAPVTRGRIASLLYKFVLSAEDPRRPGTFMSTDGDHVDIESGGARQIYPLSKSISLFTLQDPPQAVSRLVLYGGERSQFVLNAAGEVQVLIAETATGLGNDRSSRYYRWDVRTTRQDLQTRIARSYPIGELLDLQVTEIGESKRVIELIIKGTAADVTLRGIKIRWALGLRENLFVIDRIYGSDGQIASFQFSGRGWGHGVGLCQVGSYGMATRGKGYREILETYYPGVTIEKR